MASEATPERLTIDGPEGRTLEVEVAGRDGAPTVLLHLGTPCAGRLSREMVEEGERRGLRHVTYSRPGYAASDRDRGRDVADCAGDVTAVLDALSVDELMTVGMSGGGPHALAAAALLGDRVLAAATIGGVAPRGAETEIDWDGGMAEENLAEFAAAQAGEGALVAFLEREAEAMRGASAADLRDGMGELISEPDRVALDGPFGEYIASCMGAALSTGVYGWVDDDLAFERDWGFELASLGCPLTVWHGRSDRFVPPSHGEWVAGAVPGARARIEADHGHLSLLAFGYGAVLDGLLEDARR